ncbi:MAG: hypothetical protein PHR93_02020 [Acidobacteriota bacterium]|nr:hypothetical protein [Acidobacteriota bacterium]
MRQFWSFFFPGGYFLFELIVAGQAAGCAVAALSPDIIRLHMNAPAAGRAGQIIVDILLLEEIQK